MKMPSRWAFDRAGNEDEAERAAALHAECDLAIRGGYKSIRVTELTHSLLMGIKGEVGNYGEYSLDAVLRYLVSWALLHSGHFPCPADCIQVDSRDAVYTVESGHLTTADLANIEARAAALVELQGRPPAYK